MDRPPPTTPQPSGAATPFPEVIYRELCEARLWTSHYDIPDQSEDRPVTDPTPQTFEDDATPPESERSRFAADEDPEPLSHMGTEEATG